MMINEFRRNTNITWQDRGIITNPDDSRLFPARVENFPAPLIIIFFEIGNNAEPRLKEAPCPFIFDKKITWTRT